MSHDISGGKQVLKFVNTSNCGRVLLAAKTFTVATALKK